MNLGRVKEDIPGEQHKKNHLETITALGEIGSNVKKILEHMEKALRVQTELISLTPGVPTPFNTNGYRFNSLFVSDAQATDSIKLIISVDGITYTKTLAAGENEVNIPDSSSITISNTSNTGQGVVLSRYNVNKA